MIPSLEITGLLAQWSGGDREALDKLFPLIEKEMHRLAHQYMQRLKPGNTLQTTALINETYIRLVEQKEMRWQNRAHFFGISAMIMRRIIFNYARDQKCIKRGGDAIRLPLSEVVTISPEKSEELIALEQALQRLETFDEQKSRIVEMRFFGGMSVEETAEVLNVSRSNVIRQWSLAKAWLAREIKKT
jgi:RNA polymerase sigma-70 factor (ECF subfamily)